jgi:hypothetical protein
MSQKSDLKEVFSTNSGSVYQCDKSLCFWVDFAGHMTSFKVPCFFSLKKLVDKINLDEMALNPDQSADVEIINPCGCERVYVLSLTQALEFKELLSGAKVMLELNSIVRQRLQAVPA